METSVALSNAMRKDDRHKCQSLVWCKTTTIKLKRKELMTDDTHKSSESDAFPRHFTTQHVFKVHLHMFVDRCIVVVYIVITRYNCRYRYIETSVGIDIGVYMCICLLNMCRVMPYSPSSSSSSSPSSPSSPSSSPTSPTDSSCVFIANGCIFSVLQNSLEAHAWFLLGSSLDHEIIKSGCHIDERCAAATCCRLPQHAHCRR